MHNVDNEYMQITIHVCTDTSIRFTSQCVRQKIELLK